MTKIISTMSKGILGIGHVMEDENPTPIPFRKVDTSKPENVKVKKYTKHSIKINGGS